MNRQLIKGNEAIVFGALLGGATRFFGYPITPASEIAHGAARYFTQAGRTFLQAEDEVNAINMVYGAAAAGARVMTATSGPGLSLMAEGISYIAACELPCVIVDVQRAGPGLGNIWPEQSDYNAVVKGGGHGNYKNIVLAPASVQEMCDFAYRAFDLAEKYRMTVIILSDAYIGQMMEPVVLPKAVKSEVRQPWAIYGDEASRGNLITSILMNTKLLEAHNEKLQEKYATLDEITDYQVIENDNSDILFVAFGISARVCLSAVHHLKEKGIQASLMRPITLSPFPGNELARLAEKIKRIAVVELNNGMMAEDVERFTCRDAKVYRYNWLGGTVPSARTVAERVLKDFADEGVKIND